MHKTERDIMRDMKDIFDNLTDEELETLRYFAGRQGEWLEVPIDWCVRSLYDKGLLIGTMTWQGIFINAGISDKGLEALRYRDEKAERERKEKKQAGRRYWIPIIISNCLAAAAIVVAIIALLHSL